MVSDTSRTNDELVMRVALAICQEALLPRLCSCEDASFACANELPGRMAIQAIAVVRQWEAGK